MRTTFWAVEWKQGKRSGMVNMAYVPTPSLQKTREEAKEVCDRMKSRQTCGFAYRVVKVRLTVEG